MIRMRPFTYTPGEPPLIPGELMDLDGNLLALTPPDGGSSRVKTGRYMDTFLAPQIFSGNRDLFIRGHFLVFRHAFDEIKAILDKPCRCQKMDLIEKIKSEYVPWDLQINKEYSKNIAGKRCVLLHENFTDIAGAVSRARFFYENWDIIYTAKIVLPEFCNSFRILSENETPLLDFNLDYMVLIFEDCSDNNRSSDTIIGDAVMFPIPDCVIIERGIVSNQLPVLVDDAKAPIETSAPAKGVLPPLLKVLNEPTEYGWTRSRSFENLHPHQDSQEEVRRIQIESSSGS